MHLSLVLLLAAACLAGEMSVPPDSAPNIFSYEDLVNLGTQDPIEASLEARLRTLLTTPFVSNDAARRGVAPQRPAPPGLGPSLRAVFWNIERGMNIDAVKLAFTDTAGFLDAARKTGVEETALREQLAVLQSADVVVLNEVDWGLKRTGYRDVIRELGEAMRMNWAYGVEFVEVDPKILGSEAFDSVTDEAERTKLREAVAVDKKRLRALHGTAVLSRYPIREAKLIPFEQPGYDWYHGELNLARFEEGKRKAAKLLGETLGREVRRGGRTNLIVTLDVPDLKEKLVTIAATHLENRADPKVRRLQMEELLRLLQGVRNPVIIAGDMNTTGSKGKPRSLPQSMLSSALSAEGVSKKVIKYATGVGPIFSIGLSAYKSSRFQNDPTVPGIKPVAGNPEAALFDVLEAFRFADGTCLDFRGDPDRAVNHKSGTLANSNERGAKGFVKTFQFERNIGPKGWFKLDWIFVKGYTEHPRHAGQTYHFAPHSGRTLSLLNYAPEERISDHSPIAVDLPFDEPPRR
ncbi:MAG: endonuclease/exonuclease/phosphatase family protein [Bryobacterales bacterium]|nr:endonuclease/exonuclease/phosphatase family protein [Bryobacterales bacterium]